MWNIDKLAKEFIDRVDLAEYIRETLQRVKDREKYGTFTRIIVPKKEE
jgi:hypothetical protein